MLIDGVNLVEGSKIVNLTVDSGTSFPASPNTGELFYKTTDDKLYVYNGTSWILTGSDPETAPVNEIVFGTSTALDSDASMTYDITTGGFVVSPGPVSTPSSIILNAASPTGAGAGAAVFITSGDANTNGIGGPISIAAGGAGNTAGNDGGNISIEGGSGQNTGDNGDGGYVEIYGGGSGTVNGIGGYVYIQGGSGTNQQAGNIILNSGADTGTGTHGQLIFQTAGNASAQVTDNGTHGVWTFEINPYVTNPEMTSSNQLTTYDYVDTTKVAKSGSTMDSNVDLIFVGGGEVIGLPTTPSISTAAASKAYVDNLVSSSTTWRDPIECPSFQDIVTAIPGVPETHGSYIKYGGTQNEIWGTLTNVVNNDILEYSGTDWARLGTLSAGSRFLVAVERGAPGVGVLSIEMRKMDLIEYISGLPNLSSSWSKPYTSNYQGIMFSTQKIGASATGLTNNATVYNLTIKVNTTSYPITVTGSAAQTYTNLMTQINADLVGATATIVDGHIHVTGALSTDIILITSGSSPDLLASLTDFTEIRASVIGGTTILVNNPGCYEYGHVYLYSTTGHDWTEIAGPGSIGAGVGLEYDGNILNLNLGAGIQELPSDEVGIDLYSGGGLLLTTDGTTSSTATGAKLALATSGVSASTYNSVTVDDYGRVTAGTNPTTVDGFGITDAAEINPGSPKDGDIRVTGSVIDIYANSAWRQIFPAVYS